MDQKEIAAALEEIQSARNETKIILDILREFKQGAAQNVKKTESKEADTEIERLRRIVGDFHPSPDAKTYQEILKENQDLKKELEKQKTEKEKAEKTSEKAGEKIKALEKEIALLRKNVPVPGMHDKVEKTGTVVSNLTEEEQLEILRDLLVYDQRYSDSQVEFLTGLLLQGQMLPNEMLKIANPRLTVNRMQILCKMLLAKRGIVYEIPGNDYETEGEGAGKEDNSSTSAKPIIPLEKYEAESGDGQTQRLKKLAETLKYNNHKGRR